MSLKRVLHTDNMLAQFSLVSYPDPPYPDPLPQRKGSGYETRFSSAITKAVSRTQMPFHIWKGVDGTRVYRGMS